MKKLISLLLAVLMMFSVCTVAFAEGEQAEDVSTTAATEEGTEGEEDDGSIDLGNVEWILDLPFWTVKPAAKVAKIALKLVIVYLKVAKIFGLVEKDAMDYVIEFITEQIANQDATEEETTLAPATTAAAVA